MEDDDGFIPNEDDEWKTDGNDEAEDEFPLDVEDDEKAPAFTKKGSGAKTIFVTYQFRFLSDDYVVLGPLGEPGQFGVAYECYKRNDSTQTRRCVKEINKARFHHIDSDARNDVLRTMQNEIAILKKVDHPNIVKLFDVYEDRHKLHLVMEYLPGGELFARICAKEAFTEKECTRTLTQILEALEHMHDKNILHLDLKPDNILFSSKADDAPIKLIDFGMARVVPRLAKLNAKVGTPNYMAPEVFTGNYSKAADIWSVGVITFCMLFGFPPFYVDDEDITMDEHKALEVKIKNGFDPMVKDGFGAWFPADIPVSDDCRHLLTKMLEMDVKKRWTVTECLSSTWIRKFEDETCPNKTIPPIVRDALKKFYQTSKFKVAISNLFTHQIDPDHIKEIKKFFNELDTNQDGAISLSEFKTGMLTKFNTDLTDEQLEQIFSNVDLDDDREITFEELMTITAHRMLVDEDERLYQAFQDLDVDGNGLISKDELQDAIDQKQAETHKKHTRKDTIMLQRFQSAWGTADRNGDGQIDYEEFLRILHPDFGDDTMTMTDFKSGVDNSSRVRGAQFNVDYQQADVNEYVEIKPSPRAPPQSQMNVPAAQRPKTLSLNAFKTKSSKDITAVAVTELKAKNAELEEKLKRVELDRDNLREKYEKDMFVRFRAQTESVEQLQSKIETSLDDKNKLINEKDIIITSLNVLLDSRNKENDELKKEIIALKNEKQKMEAMLQHAIDSKMKSLRQSQNEIHKLKGMITSVSGSNGNSSVPMNMPQFGSNSRSGSYSSYSNNSNKKPKKARHLSHLNGD